MRLSDAGAALYARLSGDLSQLQARLYAGMDPDELEITRRVLEEVTRRATQLLSV